MPDTRKYFEGEPSWRVLAPRRKASIARRADARAGNEEAGGDVRLRRLWRWATASRAPRLFLCATALKVVLFLAVAATLHVVQFPQLGKAIAARVKAVTGRDVVIGGRVQVALGLSPRVITHAVSIANRAGGSRPTMLAARRLDVELALLPLLAGRVVVRGLTLVDPQVFLETDTRGIGNWALDSELTDMAAWSALPTGHLRIDGGTIAYRDGRTDRTTTVAVDALDLDIPGRADPVALHMAGTANGEPFRLRGTLGSLAELRSARPYPVSVHLEAEGGTAQVAGTMDSVRDAAGLALTLSARGTEVRGLAQVAGHTLPSLGSFAMTARLTGSVDRPCLTGISAELGTETQGVITVNGMVEDVPTGHGVNLRVGINAADPQTAAQRFAAGFPALPPVHAEFRLHDDPGAGAYRVTDLTASVGTSTVTGHAVVRMDEPRPQVSAVLNSPQLDVTDLVPQDRSDGWRRWGWAAPLLLTAPIPLTVLQSVDADVELTANRVLYPGEPALQELALRVGLERGHFTVQPLIDGS